MGQRKHNTQWDSNDFLPCLQPRIRSQSEKKPNIRNSASVSRRKMLATVVLCSRDFKLYFHTSHITPLQSVIELRGLQWTCLGPWRFFSSWKMKDLEEQRVWVKFCFKLGKTFTETFRCCNRLMGRTVWAVRNVTSGISVSNWAERPSKIIPNLDGLLR